MELGVHLPLMELGSRSSAGVFRTVEAARDCGFAAVAANDHFLFQAPWLDGPTALAAVVDRSGTMDLATTVALVSLRGPVPLAKALVALQVLSGGRVIAGVGPGSSARDYDAVGIPFDERWKRFDEAVATLRALLRPDSPLAPAREVPVWIGSWGSPAGLRRVARLGDGWLASAYNTTPERFAAAAESLPGVPNALATMWTWITDDAADADRVLRDVLGPLLKRDPEVLRDQVCIGPPEHCAELLSSYARAGCQRVYLWPLGDEPRQIELAATRVLPAVTAG